MAPRRGVKLTGIEVIRATRTSLPTHRTHRSNHGVRKIDSNFTGDRSPGCDIFHDESCEGCSHSDGPPPLEKSGGQPAGTRLQSRREWRELSPNSRRSSMRMMSLRFPLLTRPRATPTVRSFSSNSSDLYTPIMVDSRNGRARLSCPGPTSIVSAWIGPCTDRIGRQVGKEKPSNDPGETFPRYRC